MTGNRQVGCCPACGATLSSHHTLIEYRTTAGKRKAFAECPDCTRVDHPL